MSVRINTAITVCFVLTLGSVAGQTIRVDTNRYPNPNAVKSPAEADSGHALALSGVLDTQAPSLVFTNVETGVLDSVASYKGKVVLLKLWSLSCPPCIQEMPEISKLQDEYHDAGLRIVLSSGNEVESLRRFFTTHHVHGIKAARPHRSLTTSFRFLAGVEPTFVLIDPNGIIRDAWSGPLGHDSTEKHINKLIPQSQKATAPSAYLLSLAGLVILVLAITLFRWRSSRKTAAKEGAQTTA